MPDDRGAPGPGDGLNTEELFVRELMQRAVAEVQPDPAGLHRIRRAVPRRRAAVRGAWTGAAALAVAVAIALPALHDDDHLGLSGGPGSPTAQGGAVPTATDGGPAGTDPAGADQAPHPDPSGTVGGSPSGSPDALPSPGASTVQPGPGSSAPATAPGAGEDGTPVTLCTRGDLGQGAAHVGTADADGRIYGYFTVLNTSVRACRLGGPGAIAVTAATGTDLGRIRVTDHTVGDQATGLPAAGGATAAPGDGQTLLLAPRAGYRVDFGWVPDTAGCPAAGGATPGATAGPGAALAGAGGGATPGGQITGQGATGGAAPAAGSSAAATAAPPASASPTTGPTGAPSPTATPTAGPSTPPPTITLTHTPAPGSPAAARAVIPGACSGTVYRTAPQPLSAPSATSAPTPSASPSAG
ncbi:hypothetical protein OH807_22605 [Kitasatospora sp. NBC_01560]|uniref:hypothetical protein n=1 Tax=Kitasatospora sp. NBC_01560 TaxID=2975965 RepID=UPI00386985A2